MKSSSSSRRAPAGSPVGALGLPGASSSRRRLRLWIVWLGLSLGCGFLDWNRVQGIGFSVVDSYFYQLQVKLSARRNADLLVKARSQIVIVPISDNTFSSDNPDHLEGPPVSRAAHARVLRDLKTAGARVVVFDIVFKRPGDKKVDDELIAAAGKAGAPALWACLVENEEQKPRLALPLPGLIAVSPHVGHILAPQEDNGQGMKSITTAYRVGGRIVPALSVMAATFETGRKRKPLMATPMGWRIGALHLPDTFNIQYVSDTDEDSDNKFPSVPFEQIAAGAANDDFYTKNSLTKTNFFKDKIVVIGDETKLSNDIRNTPVGVLPGVEIQANAIASVLMAQSGAHPLAWSVSAPFAFAILALLCGMTVFIASRFSPMRGALGILLLLVGYVLLGVIVFVDHGLILHTTGPCVAVVLAALLVFFERGVWEEREKLYVRGLLGRYVSPSVADFILRYPERCALGGEEVLATVLFADIRGFTALTERFPPRVTLGLLNDYFQAMSGVVFAHDGMVDKFIGDAIMAIFGAPVPTDDHAASALLAAVEMIERLEELQVRWQGEGLPPIRIGIGIATGTMIVGNMGSEARADFSVVGDAVNLAARLQDINKEQGTTILISSATRAACEGADLPSWVWLEKARHVQVRGHSGEDEVFPVRVDPVRNVSLD